MKLQNQTNDSRRNRQNGINGGCSICTDPRCGTLDTGCPQPAVRYLGNSMCNGVFAPVCAPEVCNVPRAPHHERLIEGEGVILDRVGGTQMRFFILIEREMEVYKGRIQLVSEVSGAVILDVHELTFFEGDGEHYGIVLLRKMNSMQSMMFTLQHKHTDEGALIYVYASDIQGAPINIQGEVISGELKFYKDHMVHEH